MTITADEIRKMALKLIAALKVVKEYFEEKENEIC